MVCLLAHIARDSSARSQQDGGGWTLKGGSLGWFRGGTRMTRMAAALTNAFSSRIRPDGNPALRHAFTGVRDYVAHRTDGAEIEVHALPMTGVLLDGNGKMDGTTKAPRPPGFGMIGRLPVLCSVRSDRLPGGCGAGTSNSGAPGVRPGIPTVCSGAAQAACCLVDLIRTIIAADSAALHSSPPATHDSYENQLLRRTECINTACSVQFSTSRSGR